MLSIIHEHFREERVFNTCNCKMTFDSYTIHRFLIYSRIMEPLSKYAVTGRLGSYYEKPGFGYQHIPRFMDLLEEHYDDYLAWLYRQSDTIVKRNPSVLYYDCTNFYFECERADDEIVDEVTGEVITGPRQYGIGKEHRPNPIVEMGLFMDGRGTPITMCLHPISKTKSGEKAVVEYILDEDKIAEEEKYDGYYAVAINLADPAKEVLAVSQKRYQIEDCFRIIKTYFDGRPVNHRLPERIKAHFLICYTALLVYRLLEVMLDDQQTHVTPDHLITTLKNMNVANVHDIDYMALYKGSKTLDALTQLTMLPLDRRHYRPKDLNQIIKKILKQPKYTTFLRMSEVEISLFYKGFRLY